jgi:hypothetical protein
MTSCQTGRHRRTSLVRLSRRQTRQLVRRAYVVCCWYNIHSYGLTSLPDFPKFSPVAHKSTFLLIRGLTNFSSVSPPKHEGPKEWPYRTVSPVFTEDVGRVPLSIYVEKANDFCGNGFSHTMEREDIVPFVQLSVNCNAAVHHRLVIPEDDTLSQDWYSEIL